MQLGTRWPTGGEIPPRVPESMVVAIRAVEADIADVQTGNWRWTLTWLEGKPTAELDDGTVIRLDANGDAHVSGPAD